MIDARVQLNAALETFEQLRARPWSERAASELRGSGLTMPQLCATCGHVVVVVSVSSQWPDVSGPAYQASKAGALAFVRAVAAEEHDRGLRFTVVHPGWVATELLNKRPVPPPEDMVALSLHPEDVAATILFALSFPPRVCIAELTVLPNMIQAVGRDAAPPRLREADA